MEWKEGFLSKSIENGSVVILDNLHEANSTITERLNGLLDIKYDENKKKATKKVFDIPENPLKNTIPVHDNFRIIGICDTHNIIKMSPAFLNRFDIIALENQLEEIKKDEFNNLVTILLTREEEKFKKEEIFNMEEVLEEKNLNYISNKLYDNIVNLGINEKSL